jgi:hypothetical protein
MGQFLSTQTVGPSGRLRTVGDQAGGAVLRFPWGSLAARLLGRGTLIASWSRWFRTGNSSGVGVPCVLDTIQYLAEVHAAHAWSSGSVSVGISGFLFPPHASGYGSDCDGVLPPSSHTHALLCSCCRTWLTGRVHMDLSPSPKRRPGLLRKETGPTARANSCLG